MDPNNLLPKFFLGIPVPIFPLGVRLGNLDIFSEEECDFSFSSYPHITVTSPREMLDGGYLQLVKERVSKRVAQPILLDRLELFNQGIIVAKPQSPRWLQELHQDILKIPDFPQPKDSTWEGGAYEPHLSIARSSDPSHMSQIYENLDLPFQWTPVKVCLFIKTQNWPHYHEVEDYQFLLK